MNYKHQQQGVSLIELMISITLGVVIINAALQFAINTKITYGLNNDISRIQENGRLAMEIITTDLQMAGYQTPLTKRRTAPNFFLHKKNPFNAYLLNDSGANSDRLAIQYDPPPDDGTDADCLGITIPADNILANVYTVADSNNDGVNSLYCRGFNVTTNSWLGSGAQPLIDGIDNLQALYRVTNPNSTPATYRYISADQLTITDYPNITAVRVAVLVGNGLTTGSSENKTRQYRLLDSNITIHTNDRQLRRIYSTTVQLNNRIF